MNSQVNENLQNVQNVKNEVCKSKEAFFTSNGITYNEKISTTPTQTLCGSEEQTCCTKDDKLNLLNQSN